MRYGTPLQRFLLLYGVLFAAFGVASPFLPGLLQAHGLSAGSLGVVLAAGTAIRLLTGSWGGALADRVRSPRLVLAGFTAASALVALLYVPARGLVPLLLVSVAHAAVLAPLTPVGDALALDAASGPRGFSYGWVRGGGSTAFIVGTLLSGQMVGWAGLGIVVWLNAALLGLAAAAAFLVPNPRISAEPARSQGEVGRMLDLLAIPVFRRAMLAVALVFGSHALHDGFEVIRWRAANLSAAQCSVLWSLSVASEVFVFFFAGAPLLRWLGPGRALTVSALAGIVRWSTAARTAWFPAMAMVEPLHGLTFALLHLSAMQVIARAVPAHLAARAQAFYAVVAMGVASAALTLASGTLYGRFGAGAFWLMAGLCAAALPVALTIPRSPAASASGRQDFVVQGRRGKAG